MTADVVVFPDAAALVIGRLAGELEVPVAGEPPDPRPARFVTVSRVGGPRLNPVVDEATLTLEAWAPNKPEAHDLAQLARAHVHAMRASVVDGVTVYRTGELGGPVDLPDPESGQPRCTLTVTVALRGAKEASP